MLRFKFISYGSAAILLAGAAFAQTWEVGALGAYHRISDAPLGALESSDRDGENTTLQGKQGFGVRITLNTPGYYGHELGFVRGRATLSANPRDANRVRVSRHDDVNVDQLFYNFLMYFMPAGERWRPFIAVGAQTHRYGAPDFPEWSGGGHRNYGANYGGGIKLFPTKNTLFRLDVREYLTGKPYNLFFDQDVATGGFRGGGRLRQLELSAGFSIAF
jgi:hypothetical protein